LLAEFLLISGSGQNHHHRGQAMSKKTFRPGKPASTSARYPTTDEARSRRGFIRDLGVLLNLPLLAGVLQACGDGGRDAAKGGKPDGGVKEDAWPDATSGIPDMPKPVPDQWPRWVDGVPPQPDMGFAPQPDATSGIPDMPKLPPDQWPVYVDGLAPQPDLPRPRRDTTPHVKDAGTRDGSK
jgi:hypothetical protein